MFKKWICCKLILVLLNGLIFSVCIFIYLILFCNKVLVGVFFEVVLCLGCIGE